MSLTLQQLAERLQARIDGDAAVIVRGCASIDSAGPDEITFVANKKYVRHLETTRAAAVLIDDKTPCPDHVTRLICDDPYFAFRNALIEFVGFRDHPQPMDATTTPSGAIISSAACVHETANIGKGARIHPHVTVERGASVGDGTVLYPGAYVGVDARVGADCLIYPNVAIYDRCVLGDRVTLHASTVIGSDGFGYATHAGTHHKIPQTGIVVVEDDVELGAGCAIERAAMGETRIGKGTKFADLISIGHGTTVGAHCLFVSLVGVSGSVDVGNYVVLGGQVGVTGHLKIGDGVQAMARSAIASEIPPGKQVGGVPAVDANTAKRNAMAGTELYELFKRVRRLERELERRGS